MELKTFHESLTGALCDVAELFAVGMGLSVETQADEDVAHSVAARAISIYWQVKDIIRPWVVTATDHDWRLLNATDFRSASEVFAFTHALEGVHGALEDAAKEDERNKETHFAHTTISIRHERMFDSPEIDRLLGQMTFGYDGPSRILPYPFDCCIHRTALNHIQSSLDELWAVLIWNDLSASKRWPMVVADLHRKIVETALAEDVSAGKVLKCEVSDMFLQTARRRGVSVTDFIVSRLHPLFDKERAARLSEYIDELFQELESEMMRALGRLPLNNPVASPLPTPSTNSDANEEAPSDNPLTPSTPEWIPPIRVDVARRLVWRTGSSQPVQLPALACLLLEKLVEAKGAKLSTTDLAKMDRKFKCKRNVHDVVSKHVRPALGETIFESGRGQDGGYRLASLMPESPTK